jgi:hypothetical protein
MTTNMPEAPPPGARWRKSSHSGGDADKTDCVEVALVPQGDSAWVRDSKDPEGGAFRLPGSGWRGLLAAVQRHNDQQ